MTPHSHIVDGDDPFTIPFDEGDVDSDPVFTVVDDEGIVIQCIHLHLTLLT